MQRQPIFRRGAERVSRKKIPGRTRVPINSRGGIRSMKAFKGQKAGRRKSKKSTLGPAKRLFDRKSGTYLGSFPGINRSKERQDNLRMSKIVEATGDRSEKRENNRRMRKLLEAMRIRSKEREIRRKKELEKMRQDRKKIGDYLRRM